MGTGRCLVQSCQRRQVSALHLCRDHLRSWQRGHGVPGASQDPHLHGGYSTEGPIHRNRLRRVHRSSCSGKVRYLGRGEALREARRLYLRDGALMSVYPCLVCNYLHVGRTPIWQQRDYEYGVFTGGGWPPR